MDRYWLLTWTTYGSWLPGDKRGFVSNVDRGDGIGRRINRPGTPPAEKMRGLVVTARARLAGPAVTLNSRQASSLMQQFHETAQYRGWELVATAIMRNHVHLVLGVPGDPEPDTMLRDLKSYGSRKLNLLFERPAGGTWWTASGSRRKLPNANAVYGAVVYVRDQQSPLLVWLHPRFESELEAHPPASGGHKPAVSQNVGATPNR